MVGNDSNPEGKNQRGPEQKNPFKIYYLDDEPGYLEIFVDTFSSDLLEITTFSNPATAIEAIAKNPPDLLFLDFRLPNTNGVAIAQQVQSSIPKALVTGDMSVNHHGVFKAVFEKPINMAAVEAFIQSHIASAMKDPS